jgi:UDP-2,3-diacylglucosamine pyrophosphatase LpxH
MADPIISVFISDLHLSKGVAWTLEDFHSDSQANSLVDYLAGRFVGQRVDLVLLGDVFDLWQVVPPNDLVADSTINLTLDLNTIRANLQEIANQHPQFFNALARFSQGADNRLVIIPGNHDHALVSSQLQSELRSILVNRFTFLDRGDNLFFPPHYFYAVPRLGIYAEHGNQYDKFNQYQQFDHFGPNPRTEECQGYGLVRLFWNRLENLEPAIDDTPEQWGDWFTWLRRHFRWSTISRAWGWYQDYLDDNRVDPITIGDALAEKALAVPDQNGVERAVTPEILLNGQDLNRNLVFSYDLAVEQAYRDLYQRDSGFKQSIDQILQQKFAGQPLPSLAPLPGVTPVDLDANMKMIYPAAGPARSLIYGEPLMRNLAGMFTPCQGPALYRDPQGQRAHLDSQLFNFVAMGHTHESRWEPIPNFPNKLYANTGTWTTRTANGTGANRTVILVEERANQEIWAERGALRDDGQYQALNNKHLA